MSLTITRVDGIAIWRNMNREVVATWNDDAIRDYPEDVTSFREIAHLVSTAYQKGKSDGEESLRTQLKEARKVIGFYYELCRDDLHIDILFGHPTDKRAREFLAKYPENKESNT